MARINFTQTPNLYKAGTSSYSTSFSIGGTMAVTPSSKNKKISIGGMKTYKSIKHLKDPNIILE